MGFTIPSQWQVIGGNTDETGASQISMGKVIGGGATADGQDESTILLQNARFSWSTANLCSLAESTTYGEVSPQASQYTNTSATYVEFAQVLVTSGAKRFSIVVHCDFIGRVKAEAFNSSDASLDSGESSASTTQTQSTITLDISSVVDVYIKLSAKRESSTNPQIYSIVITETASDLTTKSTGDYRFKKIDDDVANGLQPYDAYMLQGIADNIEAAYHARGRRAGWFWPVDNRPILASHITIAHPLGMWRVSPGCNELTIRLRLTVADAAMNFGVAIYDPFGSGRLTTQETPTSVSVGGPKSQDLTLSFDAGKYEGRDVLLVLLSRSEDTASSTSEYYTESIIDLRSRIDLKHRNGDSHSLTLTSGKRWKIEFENNASGSNNPTAPGFPPPKTVIWEADPYLYVWPPFAIDQVGRDLTIDGEDYLVNIGGAWVWMNAPVGYILTVTEIGNATLLSAHVSESGFESLTSMDRRLHPGHAPSAQSIKLLYVRQRELWRLRPRCHRSIAPGWDPALKTGSDVVTHWGTISPYFGDAWLDVGACMVRGYDASLAANGSTVQTRQTLRISGLVVVSMPHPPERFNLQVRAKLASYSSGWGASEVTSPHQTSLIDSREVYTNPQSRRGYTSELVSFASALDHDDLFPDIDHLYVHFIRGAMDPSDMHKSLMPFDLTITDTSTANPRLLRLQFKGSLTDSSNVPLNTAQIMGTLWLASWGVWTSETVD